MKIPIQLFFLIVLFINVNAQDKVYNTDFTGSFVENKGQIIDQNNKLVPSVLYLANFGGYNVQIRKTGFSYDFQTAHATSNSNGDSNFTTTQSFNRVDVEFLGSNEQCQVTASDAEGYTLNYMVSWIKGKMVEGVRSFNKVTYHGLYDGIDVEMVSVGGMFKFNFILHPGADVGDVSWVYKGAKASIVDGEVVISTGQLTFKETIPESYYISTGEKLEATYTRREDGSLGIEIKEQAMNQTILIDPVPELLWGTYFGGSSQTFIIDLQIDDPGNIYIAGITGSTANIATTGAYQSVAIYGGSYYAKFSPQGQRLYATYVVGPYIKDIDIDAWGNVIICGQNQEDSMATQGAYQTLYGGNVDAFLIKFSQTGSLLWATYYGGLFEERDINATVDSKGNIVLAASTFSSLSSFGSPGTYQPTYLNYGANWHTIMAKFNPTGQRLWGTFIQGDGDIRATLLATDNWDNTIVAGRTESSTGIGTTGTFLTSITAFGMTSVGFVMKFDTTGNRSWGTYYTSNTMNSSDNFPYALTTDKYGNIIIAGHTDEAAPQMASVGAHQTVQHVVPYTYEGFLAKLNPNGTRAWGTFYGGVGSDVIFSAFTDQKGEIYIGGSSSSSAFISTPGTYKPVLGQNGDAFFARFSPGGQRKWGTYFGGSNFEVINGIVKDKKGRVFIAGDTQSTDSTSTAGAFQVTNGNSGAYKTGFLACFYDCELPDTPLVSVGSPAKCPGQPTAINIAGQLHDATHWRLSESGSPIDSTSGNSMVVYPAGTTTYSIEAVGGCFDSSQVVSIVVPTLPLPDVVATGDTAFCRGGSVQLGSWGASTYSWSNGMSNGDTLVPDSTIMLVVTGTDTSGCSSTDTMVVVVNQLPDVGLELSTDTFCINHPANIIWGGVPFGGQYAGAGISYGVFYPDSAGLGNHQVIYSYTDTHGCQNTATDTMVVDQCLGLQDITNTPCIIFYPNPARDYLIIETPGDGGFFFITDLSGKTVKEGSLYNGYNKLNIQDLPKSIYTLKIRFNGHNYQFLKLVLSD